MSNENEAAPAVFDPAAERVAEARDNLFLAVPFFRSSIKKAKAKYPDATIKLAFVAYKPEGGGQVLEQFDCEEFVEDIAVLVGALPQTTEDDLRVGAAMLVDQLQKAGVKITRE